MAALSRKLDELNEEALREVKKVSVSGTSGISVNINVPAVVQQTGANGGANVDAGLSVAPAVPDQIKKVELPALSAVSAVSAAHTFIPPRILVKKPA